ncbi:MAG TPA: carbohydrate-binding family 9-like protein [Acidobacteriota bacterium]|nr:carbohydrate-binding family 9-like protein [Acidobacteriota bacterium]
MLLDMPENAVLAFRLDRLRAGACHSGPSSIALNRLWNGSRIDRSGWDEASLLEFTWNSAALSIDFSCRFGNLNVNPDLGRGGPVPELWNYDVLEFFLRPRGGFGYFEIEVSPLGQWLDLYVHRPRKEVDWDWRSGLLLESRVDDKRSVWEGRLQIPFAPMYDRFRNQTNPRIGEVWRMNAYRVAGAAPDRRYYAWRPTFTPEPDFHVPEAFGNLIFLEYDWVFA